MDHRRTVKKTFDSKLEVEEKEDLRLQWLKDVEKDLQEKKVKRW